MNTIYFCQLYNKLGAAFGSDLLAQNLGNPSVVIQARDILVKLFSYLSGRALKKKSWHLAVDYNWKGS